MRGEFIALADAAEGGDLVEGDDADPDSVDLSSLFGDDEQTSDADDDDVPEAAVPVTDERISRDLAIEGALLDALESDQYRTTFVEAIGTSHDELLAAIELDEALRLRNPGAFTLNLRGLYPPVWDALQADPATAQITQNELPASAGIFPIGDRETTADPVWSLLERAPGWRGLTLFGSIVCLIAAVAIADRRPSTLLQFGGGLIAGGVIVAVVVFLVRALVPLMVGDGPSGPVVAVYHANTWPLVRSMMWVVGLGVAAAVLGGIARLIWPDEWVIDHVNDTGGIRSIKRRKGSPAVDQPQAAATQVGVPAGYGGYPPGAYGYPQWGAPYPGQPYPAQPYPAQPYGMPPGYGYPAGPVAQPGATVAGPHQVVDRPTVPVVPVVDADAPPSPAQAPSPAAADASDARATQASPTSASAPASPSNGSDEGPKVVASKPVAATDSATADNAAAQPTSIVIPKVGTDGDEWDRDAKW